MLTAMESRKTHLICTDDEALLEINEMHYGDVPCFGQIRLTRGHNNLVFVLDDIEDVNMLCEALEALQAGMVKAGV